MAFPWDAINIIEGRGTSKIVSCFFTVLKTYLDDSKIGQHI